MKLAGSELVFGQGSLAHLRNLVGHKATIVMRGNRMARNGVLESVTSHLHAAGIEWTVFDDVQPDPVFSSVVKGARHMMKHRPDLIIGLGGGSAMDAAKAMWVFYEHPELQGLPDILPPNRIPKLRSKARMVCIPSTSGSASEVSRSVVISDDNTGVKFGVGDMEMMPDIAICDPSVTASMPPTITAETGMDALTHATEAYVSNRANYVSDILAIAAVQDIFKYLPRAFDDGADIVIREHMLNASMVAGLAFTNVSLGIVHSMAHTLGSYFKIPHGLADAVVMPYVIDFNSSDETSRKRYAELAAASEVGDFRQGVTDLNRHFGFPTTLQGLIPDAVNFTANLNDMARMALTDGCTKTNPVAPTEDQLVQLFQTAYYGNG